MMTNEERIYLIHKKTAEIKLKNQKKKYKIISTTCLAICLLIIINIGAFMPDLMQIVSNNRVNCTTTGAASLLVNSSALGYILIGILAFLLGICVTILLYRLRNRNKYKKQEEENAKL